MHRKSYLVKVRIKLLVFVSILAIGIPALLFLYSEMNQILLDMTEKMTVKRVRTDIARFSSRLDSVMDMATWITQNDEILDSMNTPSTDVSHILKLLESQDRTRTYLIGSDIEDYVNKIVVFNSNDEFYVTTNKRFGSLNDVELIRRSREFRDYVVSGSRNVCIVSTVSLNAPYDNVLATFARSMDGSIFAYIEMGTSILEEAFSGSDVEDRLFVTCGDWVYPHAIPEEYLGHEYKEICMEVPFTSLAVRFYVNRSILSIISPHSLYLFLFIFFAAILCSYIIAHVMGSYIAKPVSKLVSHIDYLTASDDYGFVSDEIEIGDDEFSKIGHSVNSMSISIRNLLDRNEKLFNEKRDTEMRLLQMQVNPHFLYNTLESIHWMAEVQKSEGIAEMSRGLSNLLKNISKNTDDHITLHDELELLRDYERIQQVRYMGLFELIDRIPEDLKKYRVIKFTLQPLLENAIFHGLEPAGRVGKVILLGHKDDRYLYIDMIDNGIGMTSEEMETIFENNSRTRGLTGVGLKNVDQRLKLTYGEECGLRYYSQKDLYTRVSVKLPLEE